MQKVGKIQFMPSVRVIEVKTRIPPPPPDLRRIPPEHFQQVYDLCLDKMELVNSSDFYFYTLKDRPDQEGPFPLIE